MNTSKKLLTIATLISAAFAASFYAQAAKKITICHTTTVCVLGECYDLTTCSDHEL